MLVLKPTLLHNLYYRNPKVLEFDTKKKKNFHLCNTPPPPPPPQREGGKGNPQFKEKNILTQKRMLHSWPTHRSLVAIAADKAFSQPATLASHSLPRATQSGALNRLHALRKFVALPVHSKTHRFLCESLASICAYFTRVHNESMGKGYGFRARAWKNN